MKPCLLGEGLPGEGQAGDSGQARESSSSDLKRDLGLPILFEAMAAADEFVYGAAESVVLSGAADVETILYRQAVLGDCLKNRDIVRDLYSIIGETLGEEKKSSLWFSHQSPSTVLHTAIGALDLLLSALGRIRDILSARSSDFASTGFASLIRTLNVEVGDDFLEYAGNHLHELKFGGGALVGADLGVGCKGRNYRALKPGRKGMAERLRERKNSLTVQIPDGDEAGSRALEELRDRGINRVADSLARSRDHVLGFLGSMRFELAFYIGCINLHERLAGIGMGLCLPLPARPKERAHRGKGLYDICLALTLGGPVVGNDLEADGRSLFVVTGANQGGKSTFLRSVGEVALVLVMSQSPKEERQAERYLPGGHVDGVILFSLHGETRSRSTSSHMASLSSWAGAAPRGAGQLCRHRQPRRSIAAVNHLIELGRTGSPRSPERSTCPRRSRAGAASSKRSGPRDGNRPNLEESGDFSREGGHHAMEVLLQRCPDIDAVFAASDLMAQERLSALTRPEGECRKSRGRRLRRLDHAISTQPALSSVHQSMEVTGRELANVLLQTIDARDQVVRHVILETELIVRQSSGGPSTGKS